MAVLLLSKYRRCSYFRHLDGSVYQTHCTVFFARLKPTDMVKVQENWQSRRIMQVK
ncbi:MAG: hypothetical protein U5L02_02090 [Rheinheimera sp.]|nr:hypothetical protein [Rheinheimera sp.]